MTSERKSLGHYVRYVVAVIASLQVIFPQQLLAASPGGGSSPTVPVIHNTPAPSNTVPTPHAAGVNLDLSSTLHSVTAGNLHNFQPASILVNGQHQSITSSSVLTPAEVMALQQVLHGGTQTLQIGVSGNAVGGSATVTPGLSQHISALVVPHGVTILDLLSRSARKLFPAISPTQASYTFRRPTVKTIT